MHIEKSTKMDLYETIEDNYIRIPEKLREFLKIETGDYVVLGNITLQVEKAYKEDIIFNDNIAFVTSKTLTKINYDDKPYLLDEITIGCDPEFFIVNKQTNTLINPSHFFKKWNAIGYDGFLAELRPLPNVKPANVIFNIRNMLLFINNVFKERQLNDLIAIAASSKFDLTAGFHCHLGLPKKYLQKKNNNYKNIINFFVKVLDYHVGILSIIPEGDIDNQRRCMPFVAYGKVSDYRIDNRTLEYRVPGGILLKNPKLSCGLLSLCKVVITDALHKINCYYNIVEKNKIVSTETLLKDLYPYVLSTEEMFKYICVPSIKPALSISDNIIKKVEQMKTYNENKIYIKNFYNSMLVKDTNNIFKNWL